jgi:hypothetical protein
MCQYRAVEGDVNAWHRSGRTTVRCVLPCLSRREIVQVRLHEMLARCGDVCERVFSACAVASVMHRDVSARRTQRLAQ